MLNVLLELPENENLALKITSRHIHNFLAFFGTLILIDTNLLLSSFVNFCLAEVSLHARI